MENELLRNAYEMLEPDVNFDNFDMSLSYSRRFSDFNANVKYKNKEYNFNLSYKWKDVSKDIVIGLLQSLMKKIFRINRNRTINMDIYDHFIANLGKYPEKKYSDPYLLKIFEDINNIYFSGEIEVSSIDWGKYSKRTLGHYSYTKDKITISRVFKDLQENEKKYLKYVVYHEMLHKKHKFRSSDTGKRMHHTSEFKKEEKLFPDFNKINNELRKFLRKK
ncbi:MAG: SprT-like domain-containing protein [Nanobdellota archaeon]